MNITNRFPPLLESFFTDRLMQQRQASPHTIASYRDTFCLLLRFAQTQLHKLPSNLLIEDLNAPFIGEFLNYLEKERKNSSRSRNVRLAAIHSFFRYVMLHEPQYAALASRVLAMPSKRYTRRPVVYLLQEEIEALLSAPDLNKWAGLRDHALLLLAIQAGLRASELMGLTCEDIAIGVGAHVRCQGKGRKQRCTPLRKDTVKALSHWLQENSRNASAPLFPNARGGVLSHDGLEYILKKHLATAINACPSLKNKHVTIHSLRHTCAMTLLLNGVDRAVIALWLGHESVETTYIYLHADIEIKEKALAKTTPENSRLTRYRPKDEVLVFLKGL
jgi:integrase/recombinase XerD